MDETEKKIKAALGASQPRKETLRDNILKSALHPQEKKVSSVIGTVGTVLAAILLIGAVIVIPPLLRMNKKPIARTETGPDGFFSMLDFAEKHSKTFLSIYEIEINDIAGRTVTISEKEDFDHIYDSLFDQLKKCIPTDRALPENYTTCYQVYLKTQNQNNMIPLRFISGTENGTPYYIFGLLNTLGDTESLFFDISEVNYLRMVHTLDRFLVRKFAESTISLSGMLSDVTEISITDISCRTLHYQGEEARTVLLFVDAVSALQGGTPHSGLITSALEYCISLRMKNGKVLYVSLFGDSKCFFVSETGKGITDSTENGETLLRFDGSVYLHDEAPDDFCPLYYTADRSGYDALISLCKDSFRAEYGDPPESVTVRDFLSEYFDPITNVNRIYIHDPYHGGIGIENQEILEDFLARIGSICGEFPNPAVSPIHQDKYQVKYTLYFCCPDPTRKVAIEFLEGTDDTNYRYIFRIPELLPSSCYTIEKHYFNLLIKMIEELTDKDLSANRLFLRELIPDDVKRVTIWDASGNSVQFENSDLENVHDLLHDLADALSVLQLDHPHTSSEDLNFEYSVYLTDENYINGIELRFTADASDIVCTSTFENFYIIRLHYQTDVSAYRTISAICKALCNADARLQNPPKEKDSIAIHTLFTDLAQDPAEIQSVTLHDTSLWNDHSYTIENADDIGELMTGIGTVLGTPVDNIGSFHQQTCVCSADIVLKSGGSDKVIFSIFTAEKNDLPIPCYFFKMDSPLTDFYEISTSDAHNIITLFDNLRIRTKYGRSASFRDMVSSPARLEICDTSGRRLVFTGEDLVKVGLLNQTISEELEGFAPETSMGWYGWEYSLSYTCEDGHDYRLTLLFPGGVVSGPDPDGEYRPLWHTDPDTYQKIIDICTFLYTQYADSVKYPPLWHTDPDT